MAAACSAALARCDAMLTSSRAAAAHASLPRTLSSSASISGASAGIAARRAVARGSRRGAALRVRADTLATGSDVDQAFSPGAPFYKVEAVLRPWRIQYVCKALLDQGIRGVTVADVRGFGAQGGSRERQAGSEFAGAALIQKSKVEVVVVADQVEVVVDIIMTEARTGEIGDGKIFISPVAEVIRVRTGERGVEAERMAGGRQELIGQEHIIASIDGKEQL